MYIINSYESRKERIRKKSTPEKVVFGKRRIRKRPYPERVGSGKGGIRKCADPECIIIRPETEEFSGQPSSLDASSLEVTVSHDL
jgi:hypothetical protein